MTYIKINDNLIPAAISGYMKDNAWDGRESKAITVEMTHAEAAEIFVEELAWSIVMDVRSEDAEGNAVIEQEEYDNSEYSVAGSITDNRDGTVTVKMGKPTAEERLAELMEVLA